MFTNFIDNAIKYNTPGGRVSITYSNEAEVVRVTVMDTGLGISEESMKNLFTPYFRGDMKETDIPGTGLGLYMTKRLIEKMAGTVTVTSKKGAGTTFIISLPHAPSNA